MKQKSDKKKIFEGRCLGEGSDYIGFIKANEAKSIGTSCMIYDPIDGRTVDVLSMGEKEFFYIMRFRDDVKTIREQMRMDSETVRNICTEHGFRIPRNVLTTDFLITFRDGKSTAYSIKAGMKEFDPKSPGYEKLLIRQYIELEYWKRYNTDFRIVLRERLNRTFAINIEHCLSYYDPARVADEESMLKCLVAHKVVKIPMEKEIVRYASLAKGHETEIRTLYERWLKNGK